MVAVSSIVQFGLLHKKSASSLLWHEESKLSAVSRHFERLGMTGITWGAVSWLFLWQLIKLDLAVVLPLNAVVLL